MIDYQILSTDDGKVLAVDTSNEPATLVLPAPSAGFKVTIKDVGGNAFANPILIQRAGSELIDGSQFDVSLSHSGGAVSLVSDGTNWSRFDEFIRGNITTVGMALYISGSNGSAVLNVDYANLATASNGANFANLGFARIQPSACASRVRSVVAGGQVAAVTVATMEYQTFASAATALTYGNLSQLRYAHVGGGNHTRGIFAGGNNGSIAVTTIDFIQTATLANANSFGALTAAREDLAGCASGTRTIFAGGNNPASSVIDFVYTASPATASSFGSLVGGNRLQLGGCSNHLRGIFAGGNGPLASSEYINLATTSASVAFGNLSVARRYFQGAASSIIGTFAGGLASGSVVQTVIDAFNFATVSDSYKFGDISASKYALAASSNCHGGLYV